MLTARITETEASDADLADNVPAAAIQRTLLLVAATTLLATLPPNLAVSYLRSLGRGSCHGRYRSINRATAHGSGSWNCRQGKSPPPYSSLVLMTKPRSPTAPRRPKFGAVATAVGLLLIRSASSSPAPRPSPTRAHPATHVTPATSGAPLAIVLPTRIRAVATVGLLIGAVITTVFAVKAFRKQSSEVDLLQQQAERDIGQRRRAQASQVFINQEDAVAERDPYAADQMDAAIRSRDESTTLLAASLSNASKQPVYDAEVQWSIGGDPLGDRHV